jgi:hypothetical protein
MHLSVASQPTLPAMAGRLPTEAEAEGGRQRNPAAALSIWFRPWVFSVECCRYSYSAAAHGLMATGTAP